MDHDLIGKKIGAYILIERLGAGASSNVFRARRLEGDRSPVAVKILPLHLAANERLRRRFEREAQTASRLKHPNILPVIDFGEDEGAPFIAMMLVEGGTLAAYIDQGQLPEITIARVIAQVAGALDYAHSQGVIHRDIKPENILFDAKGRAYLSDFGIARLNEGTANITGTGSFIGTAAYASPEQCRGEELSAASDIYSLGIVLYEMLTGAPPFAGGTGLAIMHQHISEPVPNPLKDRPALPIEINDVLRKALAKLPGVRYQSATALSEALNHALRHELGTKPLADKAPPIGPNPVFDSAQTAPNPVPVPDDVLRTFAPTRPTPPGARDRLHALDYALPPEPVVTPPDDAPVTIPDQPVAKPDDRFYTWLLILTMITAVAVVVFVLLSR